MKKIITIVVIVLLVIICGVYFLSPKDVFIMKGDTMEPGVHDGEELVLNKLKSIGRGDIVVYKQTYNSQDYELIARVIAIPGDRLSIVNGQILIDGQRDKKIPIDIVYGLKKQPYDMPELLIPANKYFIMKDNTSTSYDSRNYGPIDRTKIIGVFDK